MNKRILKGLKMLARDAAKPGAPSNRLLAREIFVQRGRSRVLRVQAVNDPNSERGAYRALKQVYKEGDAKKRAEIEQMIRYVKMLHASPLHGDLSPYGEQPQGEVKCSET